MKTVGDKIKKCLAISLMMIYLVVSLSNLLFLPKYNKHAGGGKAGISAGMHFHPAWLYNGANSSSILFHRTCKSIIENRQNTAAFFKAAATVFLLMLTVSISGRALNKQNSNGGTSFNAGHHYAYLSFCVLRI